MIAAPDRVGILVQLDPPEDDPTIETVRIWSGPKMLTHRGVDWLPMAGLLIPQLPGDRIGGGYEHGELVISKNLADGTQVPIKVDDLGIHSDQPIHFYYIYSNDGGAWTDAPGQTEWHGIAKGLSVRGDAAVVDMVPILGDIDRAAPKEWSSDARKREVPGDKGMRWMRYDRRAILYRHPGGPTKIEDDYVA